MKIRFIVIALLLVLTTMFTVMPIAGSAAPSNLATMLGSVRLGNETLGSVLFKFGQPLDYFDRDKKALTQKQAEQSPYLILRYPGYWFTFDKGSLIEFCVFLPGALIGPGFSVPDFTYNGLGEGSTLEQAFQALGTPDRGSTLRHIDEMYGRITPDSVALPGNGNFLFTYFSDGVKIEVLDVTTKAVSLFFHQGKLDEVVFFLPVRQQ